MTKQTKRRIDAQRKADKKIRQVRYIRRLIKKLDDALWARKSHFCDKKEFYCWEAENMRQAISDLKDVLSLVDAKEYAGG